MVIRHRAKSITQSPAFLLQYRDEPTSEYNVRYSSMVMW